MKIKYESENMALKIKQENRKIPGKMKTFRKIPVRRTTKS